MTITDLMLEEHCKKIAARPQQKFEETLTSYDRDIFMYNRDTSDRTSHTSNNISYEDHRKAIETAVNVMGKHTQHDIAMCLLTHRFFHNYRNSILTDKKDFNKDYAFLIKKIASIFNPTTGQVNRSNIPRALQTYTTPTLVQVNYLAGEVTPVTVPNTSETLNEWAIKFNENAPESTRYMVAGMSIGA